MVETNSWFFRRNEMSPKPRRAPHTKLSVWLYPKSNYIAANLSIFTMVDCEGAPSLPKRNEAFGDLHAPRGGVGGTESPAKDDIVKALPAGGV
jgi:hypothetical protein